MLEDFDNNWKSFYNHTKKIKGRKGLRRVCTGEETTTLGRMHWWGVGRMWIKTPLDGEGTGYLEIC
jgi:hypothetical protein